MIRLSLVFLFVALLGEAHSVNTAGGIGEGASGDYRELVMFGCLEPHEVAPLVLGALGNTWLRSGLARTDAGGGIIAALDDAGLRYTITWHNMPGAVIMVLSHDSGADTAPFVSVKRYLNSVSATRFEDIGSAPCMRSYSRA